MTQYIDKNRVEEILRNLWKEDDGHNAEHRICYNKALQEVQCKLDTLDTLEVKDVDLEEEVDKWYNNEAPKEFEHILYWDIEKFAKYFFELGLNTQKGES